MKKLLFLLFFPICCLAQNQNVDGALKTVTASGTNSYTISGELFPPNYDPHERFIVIFTNGNTGASTLKRGSLAALPLQLAGGIDLAAGAIQAGERRLVSCNGTYYQIIGSNNLFTQLIGGPGAFTGNTLDYLRVNIGGTALEYRTPAQVLSDIGAQAGISLTTTGTSGSATFSSNTLNIPQYQGQITLTTTGSSGAATLIGNALNIPNYSGGGGLTTASQGLTAVSTDVRLGGTLTGGTLTTISSAQGNGIQFQMFDATSHGGNFQVSPAFSFMTQNSNSNPSGFTERYSDTNTTFEYPTNTVIVYIDGPNKRLGVGTGTPSRTVHSFFSDGSNVSTVGYSNRFTKAVSSGSPSSGIGVGIEFETETASTPTYKIGNTIESVSTNVGSGTEAFDLVFKNMAGGSSASEMFRMTSGGNFRLNSVGGGFWMKEGTNARMGTGNLSGGTATVSTTAVSSNSRIFLTSQSNISSPGALYISARITGVSFTVTSTNASDASTFAWIIVESF